MKSCILIACSFLSLNLFAAPYFCDGSSHFGFKSYIVSFSKLEYGVVSLQVNMGTKDLVFEKIKLKKDYTDSSLINFHGLGSREIEVSGYIDTSRDKGMILVGDMEIDLDNCK